jgi:hypothetical protein
MGTMGSLSGSISADGWLLQALINNNTNKFTALKVLLVFIFTSLK